MKDKQTHIDKRRRSFLKLSGLLGLGAASAALLPVEKAEALLFGSREHKVSATRLAMGTYVSITAIHPSRYEAEEAIGRAFEEIARLNGMLSHYEQNSPVGSFNASGKLEAVPRELQDLVARSLYYNRETGGAFDITVKPLIDLYKNSFVGENRPSEQEIKLTLRLIGSENIGYKNGMLYTNKNGVAITLDGIAKGYIVDRASAVLKAHGVSNHLINAGGDIRTSGHAASKRPWTVAVQDPGKSREYPDILSMGDGAVATSGSYEIYYDNEKMFHHIVDAQTGHSPQLSTSVTVLAPSVMDADALATAVFVMEPQEGVSFINHQPGCECLVIDRNGLLRHSMGWQA